MADGRGTLADWVGAVGALLAVVAAVVSWQTSEKVVKLEEKRDRERESAAERRQAEHVTVVGVQCPDAPQEEQYAILVVNGSDAPIYDIRVESQKANKRGDNPPLVLAVLPPGKFVIPAHPRFNWGSVIDQDVAHMTLNMMTKGKAGEMITHVSFVDAASRKWELVRGRELRSAGSDTGEGQ